MAEAAWLWIPLTVWAAFAQTLRNTAQRSLTASLGTLGLTELVFGYAVSRRVFRERMRRLELAGMAFLAAGIAVITLSG